MHESGILEIDDSLDSKTRSIYLNAESLEQKTMSESSKKFESRLVSVRSIVANQLLQLPYDVANYGKFKYSNSNYLILGSVLEKIYQKPFSEILSEKLFIPFKMLSCKIGLSG